MENVLVQTNTQLIQEAYGYFAQGDIPSLLNTLTDDVKWSSPGPKNILPWVGQYIGRQAVGEFFSLVNESTEFLAFEPREFVEQGNKVVALGYLNGKSKKTGRTAASNWVMVFTVKNGKISNFEEFTDTWAEVEAYR